jgi:hypothetical protein
MKNSIRPLQDEFNSLCLSCYNGWTNSSESLDELIGIRNDKRNTIAKACDCT